jgi:hypothetical protein
MVRVSSFGYGSIVAHPDGDPADLTYLPGGGWNV